MQVMKAGARYRLSRLMSDFHRARVDGGSIGSPLCWLTPPPPCASATGRQGVDLRALARRRPFGSSLDAARSCSLLDLMQLTGGWLFNGLQLAGGPANHGPFKTRVLAQTEMQSPLILCGKTAASGNLLHLLPPAPEKSNLGADRASVTRRSFQFELDPLVFRSHRVLVYQQRPILVGHDNVENTTIPQIGEGQGTPVVGIRDSDRRGHIDKSAGAVIQPDPL